MLVLEKGYTKDTSNGNKYWKNKALIKFELKHDTMENLEKEAEGKGLNIETIKGYLTQHILITKKQFQNWTAIQVITGMVFIENDAGMNAYHNYVCMNLAKNFDFKPTKEFWNSDEKFLNFLFKKRPKLYEENIWNPKLFETSPQTWDFIMMNLSMDVDAMFWSVPENYKWNKKFSIEMLGNQFTKEYWKENKEEKPQ